jgi:hypothetical protein
MALTLCLAPQAVLSDDSLDVTGSGLKVAYAATAAHHIAAFKKIDAVAKEINQKRKNFENSKTNNFSAEQLKEQEDELIGLAKKYNDLVNTYQKINAAIATDVAFNQPTSFITNNAANLLAYHAGKSSLSYNDIQKSNHTFLRTLFHLTTMPIATAMAVISRINTARGAAITGITTPLHCATFFNDLFLYGFSKNWLKRGGILTLNFIIKMAIYRAKLKREFREIDQASHGALTRLFTINDENNNDENNTDDNSVSSDPEFNQNFAQVIQATLNRYNASDEVRSALESLFSDEANVDFMRRGERANEVEHHLFKLAGKTELFHEASNVRKSLAQCTSAGCFVCLQGAPEEQKEENFEARTTFIVFPCKSHAACKDCFEESYKQKPECPSCRAKIKSLDDCLLISAANIPQPTPQLPLATSGSSRE